MAEDKNAKPDIELKPLASKKPTPEPNAAPQAEAAPEAEAAPKAVPNPTPKPDNQAKNEEEEDEKEAQNFAQVYMQNLKQLMEMMSQLNKSNAQASSQKAQEPGGNRINSGATSGPNQKSGLAKDYDNLGLLMRENPTREQIDGNYQHRKQGYERTRDNAIKTNNSDKLEHAESKLQTLNDSYANIQKTAAYQKGGSAMSPAPSTTPGLGKEFGSDVNEAKASSTPSPSPATPSTAPTPSFGKG